MSASSASSENDMHVFRRKRFLVDVVFKEGTTDDFAEYIGESLVAGQALWFDTHCLADEVVGKVPKLPGWT